SAQTASSENERKPMLFTAKSTLGSVDSLLQAALGLDADKAIDDLATFEDHQRRNAVDAVIHGHVRVVVDVHFADFERTFVLFVESFDNRSNHAAGTATRSPKINKYRYGRL